MHLVYELMPAGNMETAEFKKHHVDHAVLAKVRAAFPGTIIWCGGFTSRDSAQAALDTGLVDIIAFGRPYIANPDLAERLKHGWPLAEADRTTYYTRSGEVGYTDFPAYRAVALHPALSDCARGSSRHSVLDDYDNDCGSATGGIVQSN
jgi:N-ethylmaleimide reductase